MTEFINRLFKFTSRNFRTRDYLLNELGSNLMTTNRSEKEWGPYLRWGNMKCKNQQYSSSQKQSSLCSHLFGNSCTLQSFCPLQSLPVTYTSPIFRLLQFNDQLIKVINIRNLKKQAKGIVWSNSIMIKLAAKQKRTYSKTNNTSDYACFDGCG